MTPEQATPGAFIQRRLHSLTGLFLVLYLIEHLLVNSQAALFFGEDGKKFIEGVNWIHNLPYLPVIEITLIGLPLVLHSYWGIFYLWTGQQNAYGDPGTKPYLPNYPRNKAYTWQRITSWILLVGIAAHVIHMRIIDYPDAVPMGKTTYYMFPIHKDAGLDTLAARLGFEFYDQKRIAAKKAEFLPREKDLDAVEKQRQDQENRWITTLDRQDLQPGEVMVVADSFGLAELILVRETFKNPVMIVLYTILVLAACFHAFNGLWTFLISWGITLTQASQNMMLRFTQGLMILITFLGLSAIWLTYWFNLKY